MKHEIRKCPAQVVVYGCGRWSHRKWSRPTVFLRYELLVWSSNNIRNRGLSDNADMCALHNAQHGGQLKFNQAQIGHRTNKVSAVLIEVKLWNEQTCHRAVNITTQYGVKLHSCAVAIQLARTRLGAGLDRRETNTAIWTNRAEQTVSAASTLAESNLCVCSY